MSEAERVRIVLRDEDGEPRLGAELIAHAVRTLESVGPSSVVTLEGTPGAFCQGLPIEAVTPELTAAPEATLTRALDTYATLLDAVARCGRPVLALVDGPALGGGLGLAASADVVLATPRASFGLPEALIGLLPVYAFATVAARTGVPRARLLAMGGPTLSAADALRVGLADEVVDDLDAAVKRYATRFSRMDARAIAAIKRVIHDAELIGAAYAPGARRAALQLAGTGETHARLARMAAGEPPWGP